jgi:uncharacterized protein with HEPN domain
MRDAAEEAVGFAAGRARSDLDDDRMLILALLKCVETVGEAAYKVSRNYKDEHPEIPWRPLIEMRNSLVHDYYEVDAAAIWDTVDSDLPSLILALNDLICDS